MGSIKINVFGISPKKSRNILILARKIFLAFKNLKQLEGDIEIIFETEEFMRKLNFEYLKKRTIPKVLTFSYNEGILSGQIFILRSILKNQLKLKRLLTHAMLHLAGYNDEDHRSRRIMAKKEEEILKMLLAKNEQNYCRN